MTDETSSDIPRDPTDDPDYDPYGPPPPGTEEEVDPGWPWSFLLLVFAGALYLIFRLIDFVRDILT